MKLLMITGALLGFGIGFGYSWLQNRNSPNTFWHACVAAYVAALLMRWWGKQWMRGLRESLEEKQKAALAKAKTAHTPAKQ